MTNALMERKKNIVTETLEYVELELELDEETYQKLMYCQKKMNVSIDEVIRQCIYTLKDEILS